MDVEIRQMKESELSQVARLVQQVFGYDAIPQMLDSGDFSVVAVVGGNIVGQILVHPIVDPFLNRTQYYLQDVCVDEEYRGKGIASKMMHFVFDFAQENHIFRIFLTSSRNRLDAHALYEKFGFYVRNSDIFAKDFE